MEETSNRKLARRLAFARWRAERLDHECFVYFLAQIGGEAVKIGSTTNPTERLRSLRIASAHALILLDVFLGDAELERTLHEALAPSSRRNGEWFDGSAACALLDTLRGAEVAAVLAFIRRRVGPEIFAMGADHADGWARHVALEEFDFERWRGDL